MSQIDESLIEFPTPFAVKVMGRNEPHFPARVRALVMQHTDEHEPLREESRESKNGRFVSVTIEITAVNRAQLDSIYQVLTDDEDVLMAL